SAQIRDVVQKTYRLSNETAVGSNQQWEAALDEPVAAGEQSPSLWFKSSGPQHCPRVVVDLSTPYQSHREAPQNKVAREAYQVGKRYMSPDSLIVELPKGAPIL